MENVVRSFQKVIFENKFISKLLLLKLKCLSIDYIEETVEDENGFPKYRRRDDGKFFQKHCSRFNQTQIYYCFTNRHVVPYNPYLLIKYNAHINVELCASLRSVKYMYKYVYKGHDRANVKIENEVDMYLDCRYLSAQEACWRLFQFDMQGRSHSVIRMQIHLPGQQFVYFESGGEEEALEKAADSMLMGWFALNERDPSANNLLYTEVGEQYVWNKQSHSWSPRQV